MVPSPHALRRRAKKYLLRNPIKLYVPTLPGLEQITAAELAPYADNLKTTLGGVSLSGTLSTVYRANLSLRTGNRVLLRIAEFLAQNYPMLYDHARKVDWLALLGKCPSLDISVSSKLSRLKDRSHTREVLYSAIYDRLRPHGINAVLNNEAGTRVYARLLKDRCTLSLDTTGPHLHKRGYRTKRFVAPIRETTAAALLLMAGAREHDPVVDPFCGSGTFLIEAHAILHNLPPAINRSFAIEASPLNAPGTLRYVRKLLLDESIPKVQQRIYGFDVSSSAVLATRDNIANAAAKVESVRQADARMLDYSLLSPGHANGLVITNVPYGRRLSDSAAARATIAEFSDRLAKTAPNWTFAIVAPVDVPIYHPKFEIHRAFRFLNGGVKVACTFGRIRP